MGFTWLSAMLALNPWLVPARQMLYHRATPQTFALLLHSLGAQEKLRIVTTCLFWLTSKPRGTKGISSGPQEPETSSQGAEKFQSLRLKIPWFGFQRTNPSLQGQPLLFSMGKLREWIAQVMLLLGPAYLQCSSVYLAFLTFSPSDSSKGIKKCQNINCPRESLLPVPFGTILLEIRLESISATAFTKTAIGYR